MTYNFDPDRWLETQQTLLRHRHAAGELDQRQLEEAMTDLDRRYEELVDRLDGSFELPPSSST